MTLALTSKSNHQTAASGQRRHKRNSTQVNKRGMNVEPKWQTPTVMPIIQPKLKIGAPNDKFEQEANRVADQVMRMPDSAVTGAAGLNEAGQSLHQSPGTTPPFLQCQCSKCATEDETRLQRSPLPSAVKHPKISALNGSLMAQFQKLSLRDSASQQTTLVAISEQTPLPKIQRLCSECEEQVQRQPEEEELLQAKEIPNGTPQVSSNLSNQINAIRGGGQPLPKSVRAFFEPRFGQNFSHVRVQTDIASTRSLQARAYTVGRDIVFGAGQYSPETSEGKRLLAHELTHIVQQRGAVPRSMRSEETQPSTAFHRISEPANSQVSDVIQRAGDPAAIPPGLRCPTDLTPGAPAGTSVLFTVDGVAITPAHTIDLTAFMATWLASGGTDDILVHGYASTDGDQGPNWTLSCDRAEAVQAELIRLGIPAVRISVVAHGESTDFGSSRSSNRRAVVSTRAAGILPLPRLPLIGGVLTPIDNFAGRSTTRFGVGEVINLSFFSFPPRPAADFGGLQWNLVSGGGALVPGIVPNDGTATYTAPPTASAVILELRVAAGATAGRVISTHVITIVIPSAVRMTEVAGTAPDFAGTIAAGTWGAGFMANVFVDPRDVSFQGVVFGEGTVSAVVTPAGSFLSARHGLVHPANTFGPAHGGNATTGTPVSPPVDNIANAGGVSPRTLFGASICGASDFLWAIPWEFSVAGGSRTPFSGGFTANHHLTSTFSCNATIEKGGAGPFCRRINGTTC